MSEIAEYQKLAKQASSTMKTFYIIGFGLLVITIGALWPLSLVLIAIGQFYYAPKASKYEEKIKQLQSSHRR